MTWKQKHDIILNWAHSCKTHDQLLNVVLFAKKQSFYIDDLLGYCRIKSKAIEASVIIDRINSNYEYLKKLCGS